jgi:predicted O-linked N-acetylglucosamine transferase (SPINDLY family)
MFHRFFGMAGRTERLEGTRQKLTNHPQTKPLFNTCSFTGHLESAFEKICERHRVGLPAGRVFI